MSLMYDACDLTTFAPHVLSGGIAKMNRGRRRLVHQAAREALPWYTLYSLRAGKMVIESQGNDSQTILAPATILLQPGCIYRVRLPVLSDYSWLEWGVQANRLERRDAAAGEALRYSDRRAQPMAAEAFGIEIDLVLPASLFQQSNELCQRVNGLWWRGGWHLLQANNLLGSWLLSLLNDLQKDEEKVTSLPDDVAALLSLAEEQIAQLPSVQGWAKLAGCSRNTLEQRLRSTVGQSAKQVLDGLRLQQATRALRAGSSVDRSSREAGFSSRTAFTRWFTKQTGVTPVVWRASQKR